MALFVAKNGQLQTLKGVFECKEMLREGMDYERYDWLNGDGAAYIDTLIHDLSNVLILSIKSKLPTEEQTLFGRERKASVNSTQLVIYSQTNRFSIWTYNGPSSLYCRNEDTVTFDFDNNIIKSSTNQISKTLGKVDGWNLYLFGRCFNNRLYAEAGKITIGNFKIDSLINLNPCQLLQDIPSTLDNNGKARVAGECGMYDSVSGKFFGNVASTGSFTVSND